MSLFSADGHAEKGGAVSVNRRSFRTRSEDAADMTTGGRRQLTDPEFASDRSLFPGGALR